MINQAKFEFEVEQSTGSGIWRIILESVTRLAHHLNAYVFFTSHLLFVEKNEFRVVQRSVYNPCSHFSAHFFYFPFRNSAYILLFPSVRDRSSVATLARRCFPNNPGLLVKAFEHLLRKADTLSYIILDLRPRLGNEIFRIRHSFHLDAPLVSYLPQSEVNWTDGKAGGRRTDGNIKPDSKS